jgi:Ca2+/Na+ antiporter
MPFVSFIYHFVVGGIIFFLGIVLSWRTKDYSWQKKEDRRTLFFMVGGFLFYLVFQLLWHFSAKGTI